MKRCPECRRDYFDDSLLYCLDDGSALLEGPASGNEPATAIMHETAAPSESTTRSQIHTTEQTAVLPSQTGETKKKGFDRRLLAAPFIVALIALAGFVAYRYLRTETTAAGTFETTKVVKMTKSGKVISAAISPDGKYFAHVISSDGQQTLFVRQTSANNDIMVVPTMKAEYWGITFSRDSNDLYYSIRDASGIATLYRIPALGGDARKIIEGVDCPVTFSPDGKQIAFVRGEFPGKNESALLIANSDGSGEKALATRTLPERFYPIYFAGPSWSPDGKMIAAAVAGFGNDLNSKLIGFNVSDGKETEITKQEWGYIARVEWLADGNALMMIARESGGSSRQIWHLSYPVGEFRQITNEMTDFRNLSMSADSMRLVTARMDRLSGTWTAPLSDLGQIRQVVPATDDGTLGVRWAPDGRIVYFTDFLGSSNIWKMNADGSEQKQITSGGGNARPAVSPDGTRIAYVSRGIWITGIDGGEPRRLTNDFRDHEPTFSGDGRWVIYVSGGTEGRSSSGAQTLGRGLWKVAVDGGDPIKLSEGTFAFPRVSPDGKFIAAMYLEKTTTPDQMTDKIAIIPIDGGVPVKTFPIQNNPTVYVTLIWSADSKSVIYTQIKDNISNFWSQPVSGGPPKQISDFKEGYIYTSDLSPDGKEMVMSRGTYLRDAVLISNEK